MSKIKLFIEQSWLLITASFFFGLLIAITNTAWSPRIEQNKTTKVDDLMKDLLPKAEKFEQAAELQIELEKGKEVTSNIYKAVAGGQCLGWAFNCEGPGFADKIELIVAVDERFEKFAGYAVLSSNETPGFGDQIKLSYYRHQFAGAPAGKLELAKTGDAEKINSEIVAISGATVSSNAVVNIINTFVVQVKTQMQEKGLIGDDK
ncbi:MAG: FMN-binding protein [Phycisphaerae bacterium]|nr:FMN-binding protein [Phycisphaerae bacterium]